MSGAKSPVWNWLAAVAAVLALLAPALWNGFPFLYPDTGGYLARPIEHTLELNRSALYGAFLYAGVPLDFWPAAVVQAALGVWLIALSLRVYGLLRPAVLFGVTLALAIATSLPWYAGTLMPDILLSYAVLALYLLAIHAAGLHRAETIGLTSLIAFAVASHTATLVLCIGLIVALALMPLVGLPRANLKMPIFAAAVGLALAPFSNLVITGQFALTPGAPTLMFARMVEDGLVARYLKDHCPDPSVRLCAFRDKLPTTNDDWLYAPANPLGELGGWRDYEPEAQRLNFAMLKAYPGMKLAASAQASAQQFLMFKTEISLNSYYNAPVLKDLEHLTSQLMPRVLAARQQAAMPSLIDLLGTLNIIHVAISAVSILGLLAVLLLPRYLNLTSPLRAFAFTVFVALAGNAVICGTFSATVDRYQSRLVWLAPLALIVIGLARRAASR